MEKVVPAILAQTPDWFLVVLQLAGGLFLLYLSYEAFSAYRNFQKGTDIETLDEEGLGKRMLKATIMNAMSPGPYIFWSIIAGPIFLEGFRQSLLMGLNFLIGFYGTLIGGNIFFISLFASTRRFGDGLNRLLIGISALALFGFGILQLGRGLSSLV